MLLFTYMIVLQKISKNDENIKFKTFSLSLVPTTRYQNPIYVFQEMKLRGLVPNSYIHVTVSDLHIP